MTNYTDMWVSIQIGDTPEGTKGIGGTRLRLRRECIWLSRLIKNQS